MSSIHVVGLTAEEQAWYDSIQWDDAGWLDWDYDQRIAMLANVGHLASSLLERQAIPQVRLDYFDKPERNIGGHGKSIYDTFVANGTSGMDVLKHPHFIPYLWYFINGPKLPPSTIAGFCKIIADDQGTSGMVRDQIRKFVRQQVREVPLDQHKAAEGVYKLALEIDRVDLADSVRQAAMTAT